MKLISLNLAGFRDWQSRQQSIIDFIAREDPDVLLLQEVKYDPKWSAYSQSMLLNKLLPIPLPFTQTTVSKFYQPSSGAAFREGLAVLSKLPIASSESLVLTKQADDKHPRIVQNINLQLESTQVLVSNVHFSNNKYSLDQLSELLKIFEARDERRIIVGDFNISNLRANQAVYSQDYLASIDFKAYQSFPSKGLTLDYALLPQGSKFEQLEVYEGLSDHNALCMVINLGS